MSTHFVDMIHGAMARMNDERKASATNMKLGEFIDALATLDASMPIIFDTGDQCGEFDSYRGYYEDLSLEPGLGQPKPVRDVLANAQNACGNIFQGYKGGDFAMHRNTLLWTAPYGSGGGRLITGVRAEPERIVIETMAQPD